jgi:hypothetical protein
MKKTLFKIVTLYLTMLCISSIVIATHLDVTYTAAIGTAAIGCVAKTFFAWLHNEVFNMLCSSQ